MTQPATHELAPALEAGLDQLGLALPCEGRDKLLAYLDLLAKWNGTYNLTAIRDRAQMVNLHLLDSLTIARYILPGRLLDVGSGGGMPGIPLAIYAASGLPGLKVTVLDSNHKKTAFLRQAKAELKLDNLEVAAERVEAWAPEEKFTQIVSRAFSDLFEFFHLTESLAAEGCEWLAMKGVHPHDEIAQLPAQCHLETVHKLKVPGVDAERHLVVLRAA
ncbi:MAG: gidB [Betaproteobacteria bacterium]|nr:gidB [Betaproteobacteria bacterium]